ncbi:LOW QUALITY PROTEIN: acyl-coenzyme A thioesterase THEM4-like [Rhynochetos jubatus]
MWRGGSAAAAGRALSRPGWPRAPSRSLPPPAPSSPALPPPAAAEPRDYAVPNGGWSDAMRRHYGRLLATAAAGGAWTRLPSYRSARQHLRAENPPEGPSLEGHPATPPPGDTRLFLRAVEEAGAGFEYAMFLNAAERRLLCLFQPGPYLEGHPGLTHGGAVAAMVDGALGACAVAVAGRVLTANLSIDYLAPIPLGTVLLVDGRAERLEGRKVFLSGHVRSADGDTLHARATGLFIRPDPPKQDTPRDGGR